MNWIARMHDNEVNTIPRMEQAVKSKSNLDRINFVRVSRIAKGDAKERVDHFAKEIEGQKIVGA